MKNCITLKSCWLVWLVAMAVAVSGFAPLRQQQQQQQPGLSSTRLMMAVQDVNGEAAFDALLRSAGDKLVVVDYSTTWCGPCKVIAPKFHEFADKYKDAIFVSVVGDASPDASKLMKREGVRSVPSFHFWVRNSKIDVVNGANPEAIEAAITKAMASV